MPWNKIRKSSTTPTKQCHPWSSKSSSWERKQQWTSETVWKMPYRETLNPLTIIPTMGQIMSHGIWDPYISKGNGEHCRKEISLKNEQRSCETTSLWRKKGISVTHEKKIKNMQLIESRGTLQSEVWNKTSQMHAQSNTCALTITHTHTQMSNFWLKQLWGEEVWNLQIRLNLWKELILSWI